MSYSMLSASDLAAVSWRCDLLNGLHFMFLLSASCIYFLWKMKKQHKNTLFSIICRTWFCSTAQTLPMSVGGAIRW